MRIVASFFFFFLDLRYIKTLLPLTSLMFSGTCLHLVFAVFLDFLVSPWPCNTSNEYHKLYNWCEPAGCASDHCSVTSAGHIESYCLFALTWISSHSAP
uniref:Uncharacterized protein n=1 Tax=Labrus bergylta TaxID=56723 RepID=A0A3Q3GG42_9LABR